MLELSGSGGSSYPIGTREEILKLKKSPGNFASCSKRDANSGNLGCQWFDECRFRQIRDRATPKGFKEPLQGPETVAVYRELNDAGGHAAAILEVTCEGYYQSGLHSRWEQMKKTGETIKVVGIAGDGKKFRFREQTRAHVKRDPNCDACQQGRCTQTKVEFVDRELTKFPRPSERFSSHAMGMEIRQSIEEDMEREVEAIAFARTSPNDPQESP